MQIPSVKPDGRVLRPLYRTFTCLLVVLLNTLHVPALNAQNEDNCQVFSSSSDGFTPLKLKTTPLTRRGAAYQLSWLDRAVQSRQVVLIGENHWMHAIRELEQDMLFYLNEKHGFRLLVLELPYSATAYINAYINCRTDSCEKLLPYIRPFFDTREETAQLERLRNWNTAHPGREISVACSDIEQDMSYTLRYVFIPFFNLLGDKEFLPRIRKEGRLTDGIMAYMDSLLRAASPTAALPDRPFITRHYVQNVFRNFDAFYRGSTQMQQMGVEKGYPEFWKIRIRQMKDNLSGEDFFGPLLQQYRSVFVGGAGHTRIYSPPSGELPDGEGWFLANEYAPTKGKVVSIKIVNFGFDIPDSYYTGESYKNGTQQFAALVERFKSCFPEAPKGQYLLINDWTDISRSVARRMGGNISQPLRLKGHDLMQKILKRYPSAKDDGVWKDFYSYDWVIAFPGDRLFMY